MGCGRSFDLGEDAVQITWCRYYDTQDVQIKATNGKCLNAKPSRICSDTSDGWTRCASGAMPCCYSYNCDAYSTTACPEDDYALALASVYKQTWAVNELQQQPPHAPAQLVPDLHLHAVNGPMQTAASVRTPICTYGKGPLGCHSAASNAALVPFLADWVTSRGYDGLYFDEYFKAWYHTFPYPVDTDGDGKPDTLEDTKEQYNTFRPAFTAALRRRLGPDALMIANSDVGQVDPSLNGQCITHCNIASRCQNGMV